MNIIDSIDSLLQISNKLDTTSNETAYLLKGIFNLQDNTINIVDILHLDDYIEHCTNDKLSINKKFLYASIKNFSKNNWVYILVHTHPFQHKDSLTFSCLDDNFFESLWEISHKFSYEYPMLFGVIGKESFKFKLYSQNDIIEDINLYSKYDELDPRLWDIEILSDNKYRRSAIYNKYTNSLCSIDTNSVISISSWLDNFKKNKLSNLQSIAFKNFIYTKFYQNLDKTEISSRNFSSNKIIDNLELMIQLGCNLKCKYCYADEGTYGTSENIILDKSNAINILNSIVNHGIIEIKKITFFGGEPCVYPESIKAICDQAKLLFNTHKLISMPTFYMVTKGTVLNSLLISTIKEYDIKLTVSLDGPAHINDQLRINKNNCGTSNDVLNSLAKLKENKIKPVMIEATYTNIHENNNISREKLTELLKNQVNIETIYLADCTANKFRPLSKPDNYSKLLNALDEILLNKPISLIDRNILSMILQTLNRLQYPSSINDVYCSAGYTMISVLGNGDYYPCHRFIENSNCKIGNFLEEPQLNFKSFLKKDNIKSCSECWASEFCNKCTWELMNQNYDSCTFNTLNKCDETKNRIKHILLTYINLELNQKKNLIQAFKQCSISNNSTLDSLA